MKSPKPPALAAWLLEHSRFSATDDALAGDLLEEFHQRRSPAWYWRQVLVAILVGCASEVRHHRVLAIRAIVISWAANFLAMVLGREVMFEWWRLRFFGLALHPALASFVLCFLAGAVSGLIVAFLHRKHRTAVLLTCAGTLPGWVWIAVVLFKRGALQHSFLQIAIVAMIYYAVALPGFLVGGFLLNRAPKAGTPPSEHQSPAY
jgi:hypothetical protein